jgi:rhodanese-related sulfurtransferase
LVSIADESIINLPLSTSEKWAPEIQAGKLLDSSKPTICLCHHGMRSMRVATFLVQNAAFEQVFNVEGGINMYAIKSDPSIGTY